MSARKSRGERIPPVGRNPTSGAYSASKAAAEAAFEAIAIETAPAGVHVTIVEPGVFATELADAATMVPRGLLYEPTVGRFRQERRAGQTCAMPPSTMRSVPVTYELRSDPR